MKKLLLLAGTAVACVAGYSHGRTDTVWAKQKGSKDPIRVNKSDFDADQESDSPNYSAYKGKDPIAARANRSDVNVTGQGEDGEVLTTAAPSAPDFSEGEGKKLPTDETKNAVAPAVTSQDQLLVMKSGKKFYITDGLGKKITGNKAELLGIDEKGYDTEEAAKAVQSSTEPKETP